VSRPVGPSCRLPETSGSHRFARDSRSIRWPPGRVVRSAKPWSKWMSARFWQDPECYGKSESSPAWFSPGPISTGAGRGLQRCPVLSDEFLYSLPLRRRLPLSQCPLELRASVGSTCARKPKSAARGGPTRRRSFRAPWRCGGQQLILSCYSAAAATALPRDTQPGCVAQPEGVACAHFPRLAHEPRPRGAPAQRCAKGEDDAQ
jgi:hypothetical protein